MNNNLTTDELSFSLADIAAILGLSFAAVASWLYYCGWIYIYYYFDRFRVPMELAGIQTEHLLVYGSLASWNSWYISLSFFAAECLLIGGIIVFRYKIGKIVIILFSSIIIFVTFAFAHWIGSIGASNDFLEQRKNDYSAYPRVNLNLVRDQESAALSSEYIRWIESGCLKLLISNQNHIFLIRPILGSPATELHTMVIPWSNIDSFVITDNYVSCE